MYFSNLYFILILYWLKLISLLFLPMVITENINYSNSSKIFHQSLENDVFTMAKRWPRLFSFHALEEDLKIELEFSVPFISVPTKSAKDMANKMSKGFVNINLPALVVSGLMVIIGASIGSVINNFAKINPNDRMKTVRDDGDGINYYSSIFNTIKLSSNSDVDSSEITLMEILEGFEEKLRDYNIDIYSCFHKLICSLVKKSSMHVENGFGTSFQKILDGFVSSEWLLKPLQETAIKDAIDAGKRRFNCDHRYFSCKLSEQFLIRIFESAIIR